MKSERYVDDTFCYVKIGTQQNIQFTYESENNNQLAFLDVLLIRNNTTIKTTVYRKSTNSDIYLNWKSFSPCSWKRGTSKTITRRAYLVCSTPDYLQEELDHMAYAFEKFNNYPKWVNK